MNTMEPITLNDFSIMEKLSSTIADIREGIADQQDDNGELARALKYLVIAESILKGGDK